MNIWNTKDKNLKELCNVENAEKQQKTKSNTGKRLFELIEFVAVVSICIFMFFYEQGVALNLQTGDSVSFGTYLGEPIQWRVIKIGEDWETVLISEKILTFKAFDAPASGVFNEDEEGNSYWSVHETEADRDFELQAFVRGSNCWADSDIRAWLNSDEETVRYEGIGPIASAMSENKNGYIGEPGFLTGFSKKEKAALLPTQNITNGNALDKTPIETTDFVYLLSKDELSWLKEANVSIYALPTRQAVQQDQTLWYRMFSLDLGLEAYLWWLREPVPDKSSRCYMVDNGYRKEILRTMEVGTEGFGIRPVVKVNAKKIKVAANNG